MVAKRPTLKAGQKTRLVLVLGGARSGKSAYAETRVRAFAGPRGTALYLATAEPRDTEMQTRIDLHRERRGKNWRTLEVPLDIAATIAAAKAPMLVDCLTLWLANMMFAKRDIDAETQKLLAALKNRRAPIVLVSNEVGLGIVPDNKLARDFRDHAGRLHQAVASIATDAIFVAAGLPLALKGKTT
jgi:adenosylcobinamide kinase / adenosylcobinamide-phosphate guanylyltransferase